MQQRFLLQILLLAQHVSGTIMPIIRSSWVLYTGCCLWYLVLWFSRRRSSVELRVMCPVCRMLQHPAKQIPQAATTVQYSWTPDDGHSGARKHVEQAIRSAIKTSVASSWHFISTHWRCRSKSHQIWKILYSRAGHRWQYGACSLHSGYLRLQT